MSPPTKIDAADCVTREEACALLGVSLSTLIRMIRAGELSERRYFNAKVVSRREIDMVKKRRARGQS